MEDWFADVYVKGQDPGRSKPYGRCPDHRDVVAALNRKGWRCVDSLSGTFEKVVDSEVMVAKLKREKIHASLEDLP